MDPIRAGHSAGTEPLELSTVAREKARQSGPAGLRWLDGLPALVSELAGEWSLTVLGTLTGGSASLVLRVRTGSGADAVLKLAVPSEQVSAELDTLARADGHGYARLLAGDPARGALLLEALGPSLERLGLPPEDAIAVLGGLLPLAWAVPPPAGMRVEPGQDRASQLERLVTRLWRELGGPCPDRVLERALLFARRRAAAFHPDRCVLVHGDPHPGNALRAADGFRFVDPDGLPAEAAYDCGVVLRDWCTPLLAGDAPALARYYCSLLAGYTGVDWTASWEWGFLERVSTGLYLLSLGAEREGARFLEVAELLA